MAWTISDFNFKKLLNKRVTSAVKKTYEEISDYTINVHADEIWAQTIPANPSSDPTIVESRTLLVLTNDTTVSGSQCWYATDGSGNRLKDWISEKFGDSYTIKLFDQSNNPISATDPSNWLFDYQTGILTLQNTHTTATGFKITGYRYIGSKGVANSEGVVNGEGTTNYIPIWIDSNTIDDSIMSQNGTSIISINGTLRATSKSFDIPHPTKPGHRLVYGCLEGPENGAYFRGRSKGNNEVIIELPDYWSELVDSYSIYLTSHGNYSLYVKSQDKKSFIVKRCSSFINRKKFIEFSYIVIGNRKDAKLITEYKIG